MKLLNTLFITLLAISIGGCGAATEQKKVDEKTNTTTSETNTTTTPEMKDDDLKKDDTAKKDDSKTENTSDLASKSPSEIVKTFIQAYRDKDVATMKNIISKKSLEEMEKEAKTNKQTLDEHLNEFMKAELPFKGDPELQNEKIDGDKATVEIKVENKWEPTQLVKEDGQWKFTFEQQK